MLHRHNVYVGVYVKNIISQTMGLDNLCNEMSNAKTISCDNIIAHGHFVHENVHEINFIFKYIFSHGQFVHANVHALIIY